MNTVKTILYIYRIDYMSIIIVNGILFLIRKLRPQFIYSSLSRPKTILPPQLSCPPENTPEYLETCFSVTVMEVATGVSW